MHGVPVPIGGRAFEIIEVLVQSAGELVTKNDLMGRVWPGAIVEDNTLQFHISAIRKALGADRGKLKTASGRGYRLLGAWALRQENTCPICLYRLRAFFASQSISASCVGKNRQPRLRLRTDLRTTRM